MRRSWVLALVASGIAAAAPAASAPDASAPAAPRPGEAVQIHGCVEAGVEHGCLVVRSGRRIFDVTALGLKAGDPVHGSAVVSDRMSYCMQGVIVGTYRPDPGPAPHCPAGRTHVPEP